MISETNVRRTQEQVHTRIGVWVLIAGIILVAANLRASLTDLRRFTASNADEAGYSRLFHWRGPA